MPDVKFVKFYRKALFYILFSQSKENEHTKQNCCLNLFKPGRRKSKSCKFRATHASFILYLLFSSLEYASKY